MKKLLLLCVVAIFALSSFAQNRIPLRSEIKNIKLDRPILKEKDPLADKIGEMIYLNHNKAGSYSEEEIGQTVYDVQCNTNVDSRNWVYSDGRMVSTYTFGTAAQAFPERGTGYQYFDGTAWLSPLPSARIETIRTGWPSYGPLGNGECVVAHNGTQLVFSKRAAVGSGSWTQSLIPYDAAVNPTWPRMCTSGDNVYVLAADQGVTFNGITDPLLFYRSQDAGATWDISCQIPAELMSYTQGVGVDNYSWAKPVGNTIAFVAGDTWKDLVLMKSTDGGTTWNKTVIFAHPYPDFVETTTITDTIYACDGAVSVALDASGNAYVAFGIMRVLNDDLTDGNTSYFPAVDGMGFWKEGDPMITSMDPDTLYNNGKLVAWIFDLDATGVIYDAYTASENFPTYGMSQTSMPQIMVDNGNIFLVYKGTNENMVSATGQFYSHIWARASYDGGLTWCDFFELTDGIDHDQVECIWPCMAKDTYNGNLYFSYMSDFEPGLGVGTAPEDPAGSNSIYWGSISTGDIPFCVNVKETNLFGDVNIYPNPVVDYMDVNFAFNKTTSVKMNIYNSVGSLVDSKELVVGKGEASHVNTSNLSTGIYLVKFETENGTFTKKIIKK